MARSAVFPIRDPVILTITALLCLPHSPPHWTSSFLEWCLPCLIHLCILPHLAQSLAHRECSINVEYIKISLNKGLKCKFHIENKFLNLLSAGALGWFMARKNKFQHSKLEVNVPWGTCTSWFYSFLVDQGVISQRNTQQLSLWGSRIPTRN